MVEQFIPTAERWRAIAAAELATQQIPLPVELILAVIQRESGGHTGEVNPKSGASGLMQVMPIAVKDYNQRSGAARTMVEMKGKTDEDGRKQIEVGIGVLGHFWHSAYKYMSKRYGTTPVAIEELAKIADLFYAAGPGAAQNILNKVPPPLWDNVQVQYPQWNALPHPRHVLKHPKPWNLSAIQTWLDKGGSKKKNRIAYGSQGGIRDRSHHFNRRMVFHRQERKVTDMSNDSGHDFESDFEKNDNKELYAADNQICIPPTWEDMFNLFFTLWKTDLFRDAFHHLRRGWGHWNHSKDFSDDRIYNDFIAICDGDPIAMERRLNEYRDAILIRLKKRFESAKTIVK